MIARTTIVCNYSSPNSYGHVGILVANSAGVGDVFFRLGRIYKRDDYFIFAKGGTPIFIVSVVVVSWKRITPPPRHRQAKENDRGSDRVRFDQERTSCIRRLMETPVSSPRSLSFWIRGR